MKEPRTTILASKVSVTTKRGVTAAAALEGISVSAFTRDAVVRAYRERIAETLESACEPEVKERLAQSMSAEVSA